MTRFDRGGLVATVVVAITLLQVGAAAFVRFAQADLATKLEAEQVEQQRCRDRLSELRSEASAPPPTPIMDVAPRWQLLNGPDVAATLEKVNALGVEAKVDFDSVRAGSANTVGKQPFRVAGRGSPRAVVAFLAAIEQAERLVIVENGRITPGEEGLLFFDLGLATYHTGARR